MQRVSCVVAVLAVHVIFVSNATGSLIEVTATGHIESITDWPDGLVVGDPVLLSYVVDLADPHFIESTKSDWMTGYTATSVFLQAGDYSISRNGPVADAVKISGNYGIAEFDIYEFHTGAFETPFMGVEPFGAGISLRDTDVFATNLHPMELDVADFGFTWFHGTKFTVIPEGDGDFDVTLEDIQIQIVPEPGTLALLLFGAIAAGRLPRRR